ncbi:MAG: hypothetical protein ACLVJ6_04340 [Merdibacter sp.]
MVEPVCKNQATDRAHRIGQHNNVQVYQLIMKGTIEERIRHLQEKKKDLADLFVRHTEESAAFDEQGRAVFPVSVEEVVQAWIASFFILIVVSVMRYKRWILPFLLFAAALVMSMQVLAVPQTLPLANRVYVIDSGHGGKDDGAQRGDVGRMRSTWRSHGVVHC